MTIKLKRIDLTSAIMFTIGLIASLLVDNKITSILETVLYIAVCFGLALFIFATLRIGAEIIYWMATGRKP